jgi:Uma2 family endonuclease
VTQHLPTGYVFNPEDPRAPTHAQWEAMTPAERDSVVATLPARVPLDLMPPEGDWHRKAKESALRSLDDFFRRAGRRIYLSSELAVFYPGERRFAPDLLAVLDVDPHERMTWTVDKEGRGLDLVIEVHVAGSPAKDDQLNVERYARLGIHEYFIFDRGRSSLQGYRLAPAKDGRARAYQRMMPQVGRYTSEVLGLDLRVEGTKLRFFAGNAPLEDVDETIARLGSLLDEVIAHKDEAERLREELEQRAAALTAELAEEKHSREDAERRLAEALAEIARLKKPLE